MVVKQTSIFFMYDQCFILITPELEKILGYNGVITKAPIYAVERIKAIQRVGFTKSEHLLGGHNGYTYDGYWVIQ